MVKRKLKRVLKQKSKKEDDPTLGVSTGSTILNLACTGSVKTGLYAGHYYLLVGDSRAGKSWLAHSILAEATINSEFDGYELIYDDIESGALMDVERYFGSRLSERMRPPKGDKQDPQPSETVEDLYDNIERRCKDGTPFIYIVDSMDALSTEEDEEKYDKAAKARKKGTKEKGSYGTAKAKINSTRLRRLMPKLRKSGSILIIISQTRDNLGGFFATKTRSGGHALRFYATLELWLSVKEDIKRTVKNKNRNIGIVSRIRIRKNRIQGKDRDILVPLYHSSGLDDVGGCIKWLIDEGHWQGTKTKVKAPEFKFSGTIEELVSKIQERGRESKLFNLSRKVWREIESKCQVPRKNKYEQEEE